MKELEKIGSRLFEDLMERLIFRSGDVYSEGWVLDLIYQALDQAFDRGWDAGRWYED